jgi:uncharacterized protein YbjT (DUF2867 family)
MARGKKILLIGASGAVGQAVLAQALARNDVATITALTRKPLANAPNSKQLRNLVIDFAQLDADDESAPEATADFWACDAVICTLGTTIKIAGSQAAFAAVDRDLPIKVGRLAKAAGATRYALNSSLGASLKGNFYLRTKAQAEQGIIDLGFKSTTLVRPSLIDAPREQGRPAERLGIIAARSLRALIPARYRVVTPEQIARALLDGALTGAPGVSVVESDQL